jgi:peptidoglycan/LPS O-acetylase OafA/YrhL
MRRWKADNPGAAREGTLRHRDDLQGLRAVAVLLVVLSHAGVGFVAGGFVGVDVFFVLSGFLITSLLLAEALKRGEISLREFYARRAKRILPAATLTLLVTDVAAYAVLNAVRAKQVVWDSISALFFVANVHFAHGGTDYFARAQPPSPVQNYWTLAVEEQFYLVWPAVLGLVIFGIAAWSHSRRRDDRRRLTSAARTHVLVLACVAFAASLAWSIHQTNVAPTSAYFSTLTRAWELALGAIVAIAAPHLKELSRRFGVWIAAHGLIAIGAAAFIYTPTTPFPGYAALLPTLGSALVIVGGLAAGMDRVGVGRALGVQPLRFVGDRSYAYYLWHWPVLILAADYEGRTLSVGTNLVLLVAAFGISCLTYAFFEDPIRRAEWEPRSALVFAATSIGVAFVAAGLMISALNTKLTADTLEAAPLVAQFATTTPTTAIVQSTRVAPATNGALPAVVASVRQSGRRISIAGLQPSVTSLLNDHYVFPKGCSAHDGESSSKLCRLGDAASKRVLVVFGDSHAEMWMPAILALAQRDHWAVIPIDKSACTPHDWATGGGSGDCDAWYPWAIRQAKRLRPDVFLVTGAMSGGGQYETQSAAGIVKAAWSLRRAAKSVVVVRDAPGEEQQPLDCVLGSHATIAGCSLRFEGPRAEADLAANEAIIADHDLHVIDTMPWFCADDVCPTVIGKTIAYLDTGHVTATYASELAGPFRTAFRAAIGNRQVPSN